MPRPRRLLLALPLALAAQLAVYNESQRYAYHGCYNETTDIAGSDRARALAGGISEVRRGEMTVPLCLGFCAGGRTTYRYAGLEWSRECWCSQTLSGIAARLDDAQCNFPCEGDDATACGGSLKLSVYRLSGAAVRLRPSALAAASGLVLALVPVT